MSVIGKRKDAAATSESVVSMPHSAMKKIRKIPEARVKESGKKVRLR